MTKQEFEKRTITKVTEKEFDYIHSLYLLTAMDKDEFCRHYISLGDGEILRQVYACAVSSEIMRKEEHKMMDYIAGFLIGKAHAYNDTDFYNEAVRLIGQKEVTRKTLESGMPLWEEDAKFLKELLIEK